MVITMFDNIYLGKKVLVTGHTGFKGAWLTSWLLKLGANVCGISIDVPTQPSMFEEMKLKDRIEHHISDVCDYDKTNSIISNFKPDFIFHLAAQAIVSLSYESPLDTIKTNVIGTATLLECLRNITHSCTVILITSDKCYENVEWVWGYKETDALGGKDIYSGSKGAAEVIIHAYQKSFFEAGSNVRMATARAGNVIGGGDWAKDRIVVDCMKNWAVGERVEIRSPEATRPWQHVLEPLSGYLTLGSKLSNDSKLNGESFNFGPKSEQNHTVLDLLKDLSRFWDFETSENMYDVTDNIPFHEAGLLKLNCDKALFHLKWEANLGYEQCVKFVSEWYFSFYQMQPNVYELTMRQLESYENLAIQRKLIWTKH